MEFIHIPDWILINLEFKSKAQMTPLPLSAPAPSHFLPFLIDAEGNQSELESQEKIGFDVEVSLVGWKMKIIIAVASGVFNGPHLGRNAQ